MNEILTELGCRRGCRSQIGLFVVFGSVTGFFLTLGHLAGALGVNPVVLHVMIWGGWFLWQGHIFAEHRRRYLDADPATAYRTAFRRDIVAGVSLGVAQMFRPAWYGFLTSMSPSPDLWVLIASLACMAAGAGLLYTGFRTIGFDGAGFLYEYRERPAPLVQAGIYGFIRHPLFLGGALVSVGTSLPFGGVETLTLATVNVLILPIYMRLEDARLIRVFGDQYRSYRVRVGGLIPKFAPLEAGDAVPLGQTTGLPTGMGDCEVL